MPQVNVSGEGLKPVATWDTVRARIRNGEIGPDDMVTSKLTEPPVKARVHPETADLFPAEQPEAGSEEADVDPKPEKVWAPASVGAGDEAGANKPEPDPALETDPERPDSGAKPAARSGPWGETESLAGAALRVEAGKVGGSSAKTGPRSKPGTGSPAPDPGSLVPEPGAKNASGGDRRNLYIIAGFVGGLILLFALLGGGGDPDIKPDEPVQTAAVSEPAAPARPDGPGEAQGGDSGSSEPAPSGGMAPDERPNPVEAEVEQPDAGAAEAPPPPRFETRYLQVGEALRSSPGGRVVGTLERGQRVRAELGSEREGHVRVEVGSARGYLPSYTLGGTAAPRIQPGKEQTVIVPGDGAVLYRAPGGAPLYDIGAGAEVTILGPLVNAPDVLAVHHPGAAIGYMQSEALFQPEPERPPQEVVTKPERLTRLRLEYPSRALRREVEGYVIVRFVVEANGSVRDVRVVNGDRPRFFTGENAGLNRYVLGQADADLFEGELVSAFRSARYSPQQRNGIPERSIAEEAICFQLEGGQTPCS